MQHVLESLAAAITQFDDGIQQIAKENKKATPALKQKCDFVVSIARHLVQVAHKTAHFFRAFPAVRSEIDREADRVALYGQGVEDALTHLQGDGHSAQERRDGYRGLRESCDSLARSTAYVIVLVYGARTRAVQSASGEALAAARRIASAVSVGADDVRAALAALEPVVSLINSARRPQQRARDSDAGPSEAADPAHAIHEDFVRAHLLTRTSSERFLRGDGGTSALRKEWEGIARVLGSLADSGSSVHRVSADDTVVVGADGSLERAKQPPMAFKDEGGEEDERLTATAPVAPTEHVDDVFRRVEHGIRGQRGLGPLLLASNGLRAALERARVGVAPAAEGADEVALMAGCLAVGDATMSLVNAAPSKLSKRCAALATAHAHLADACDVASPAVPASLLDAVAEVQTAARPLVIAARKLVTGAPGSSAASVGTALQQCLPTVSDSLTALNKETQTRRTTVVWGARDAAEKRLADALQAAEAASEGDTVTGRLLGHLVRLIDSRDANASAALEEDLRTSLESEGGDQNTILAQLVASVARASSEHGDYAQRAFANPEDPVFARRATELAVRLANGVEALVGALVRRREGILAQEFQDVAHAANLEAPHASAAGRDLLTTLHTLCGRAAAATEQRRGAVVATLPDLDALLTLGSRVSALSAGIADAATDPISRVKVSAAATAVDAATRVLVDHATEAAEGDDQDLVTLLRSGEHLVGDVARLVGHASEEHARNVLQALASVADNADASAVASHAAALLALVISSEDFSNLEPQVEKLRNVAGRVSSASLASSVLAALRLCDLATPPAHVSAMRGAGAVLRAQCTAAAGELADLLGPYQQRTIGSPSRKIASPSPLHSPSRSARHSPDPRINSMPDMNAMSRAAMAVRLSRSPPQQSRVTLEFSEELQGIADLLVEASEGAEIVSALPVVEAEMGHLQSLALSLSALLKALARKAPDMSRVQQFVQKAMGAMNEFQTAGAAAVVAESDVDTKRTIDDSVRVVMDACTAFFICCKTDRLALKTHGREGEMERLASAIVPAINDAVSAGLLRQREANQRKRVAILDLAKMVSPDEEFAQEDVLAAAVYHCKSTFTSVLELDADDWVRVVDTVGAVYEGAKRVEASAMGGDFGASASTLLTAAAVAAKKKGKERLKTLAQRVAYFANQTATIAQRVFEAVAEASADEDLATANAESAAGEAAMLLTLEQAITCLARVDSERRYNRARSASGSIRKHSVLKELDDVAAFAKIPGFADLIAAADDLGRAIAAMCEDIQGLHKDDIDHRLEEVRAKSQQFTSQSVLMQMQLKEGRIFDLCHKHGGRLRHTVKGFMEAARAFGNDPGPDQISHVTSQGEYIGEEFENFVGDLREAASVLKIEAPADELAAERARVTRRLTPGPRVLDAALAGTPEGEIQVLANAADEVSACAAGLCAALKEMPRERIETEAARLRELAQSFMSRTRVAQMQRQPTSIRDILAKHGKTIHLATLDVSRVVETYASERSPHNDKTVIEAAEKMADELDGLRTGLADHAAATMVGKSEKPGSPRQATLAGLAAEITHAANAYQGTVHEANPLVAHQMELGRLFTAMADAVGRNATEEQKRVAGDILALTKRLRRDCTGIAEECPDERAKKEINVNAEEAQNLAMQLHIMSRAGSSTNLRPGLTPGSPRNASATDRLITCCVGIKRTVGDCVKSVIASKIIHVTKSGHVVGTHVDSPHGHVESPHDYLDSPHGHSEAQEHHPF